MPALPRAGKGAGPCPYGRELRPDEELGQAACVDGAGKGIGWAVGKIWEG